jgi:HEAT repeat protein
MRRAFWILLFAICNLTVPARSQQSQDNSSLFAELDQVSTTDRAAKHILAVASQDPSVRQQAAEKLPGMIDKSEMNEVWLNAVRLAGQLKVSEAVPVLQKAFSLGKLDIGRPAVMTMSTEILLNDDVVAKALAEIGEPSLPAVKGVLKSPDPKMRRRAVLILRNINSPGSRSLLQEHLPDETDPGISSLIRNRLDHSGQ